MRLFTTTKLFDETFQHLGFARSIIRKHGADLQNVIASATGDTPYWRQNLFHQGFIGWRHAGSSDDWESYLHTCFGSRYPDLQTAEKALSDLGISVIDFQDWPGFTPPDFASRDSLKDELKHQLRRHRNFDVSSEAAYEMMLEAKVSPRPRRHGSSFKSVGGSTVRCGPTTESLPAGS